MIGAIAYDGKANDLKAAYVGPIWERPGAPERLAELRQETLEEIRLYELRHSEAISQVELAGRLDASTQSSSPGKAALKATSWR